MSRDAEQAALLAACRTWQSAATQRGAGHRNDAGRRPFECSVEPQRLPVGGEWHDVEQPTPTSAPTSAPTETAVPTPTVVPCVGDCNGDGQVTVNEILTLVNIALGNADATACPNGIPSGAQVDVALILTAVNNALNGCQ